MMMRMIRGLGFVVLIGTLVTPANSAQYSIDEIQSSIQQLGTFSSQASQNAGVLLIDAGSDALSLLHAELRSVTATEKGTTDFTTESAERTATQKVQLLNILGEIGEFASATEIVASLRETPADHMAQIEGFAALAKLGPAQITMNYAQEVLNAPSAGIIQKRAAFTPLLLYPQPSMTTLVETFAAASAPVDVRDVAILLGARLGLKNAMLPLIEAWLAAPLGDYGDYNVLIALAELVPPVEFATKVAGISVSPAFVASATRYNRFKWSNAATRASMVDTMFQVQFHEELLLALSHLLEQGNSQLLKEMGVLYTAPNQPLALNPTYKPFIQMLGYRYDGQGHFERMFDGQPVQAP